MTNQPREPKTPFEAEFLPRIRNMADEPAQTDRPVTAQLPAKWTGRRFYTLRRHVDVSGVSGTGQPAEIAVFSDGQAAIHWFGKYPTTTAHPGGLEWTEGIHGHGGATTIEPLNDPRLARIAEAHSADTASGGMTSGYCVECDHPWPCPTYTWAATDRDPLATWDPADDEEPEMAPCSAGLLPKGDAPAERCMVEGPHDMHVSPTGKRWRSQ